MKGQTFSLLMAAMITFVVAAITFDRCQERKQQNIIPITIIKQVDSAKTAEFKLQPQIDSLNNLNGLLISKAWEDKKSLSFLQSENRRLAKLAEAHIDSMGLYEPPDSNENDYAGNIKEVIAACEASDSAANVTIRNLDSINRNYAQQIILKDSLANTFKKAFNTSIEQQTRQEKYILTLRKQAKTRGTLNKILGGIALVGTGFILNAVIK